LYLLDLARFQKTTIPKTLNKNNGYPKNPTTEGFLDKAQSKKKQRLACMVSLSKKSARSPSTDKPTEPLHEPRLSLPYLTMTAPRLGGTTTALPRGTTALP